MFIIDKKVYLHISSSIITNEITNERVYSFICYSYILKIILISIIVEIHLKSQAKNFLILIPIWN